MSQSTADTTVNQGSALDFVDEPLVIGKYTFKSRLIVGTGKYATFEQMEAALERSDADLVTVAVRRIDLTGQGPTLLDFIDVRQFRLLPNTAGCYTAEEAVRYARLAREAFNTDLIKLEVIGDKTTLFPDNEQTLVAAKTLLDEGFTVMPYISDDLVTAQRLLDMGCPTVMPLAAPIGSGLGICNPYNLRIMRELIDAPIIVDAGVGVPSDAALVMELGMDGVLMNTGIAQADNPIWMAEAMRDAVRAGRKGFKAGRIPKKLHASASSVAGEMLE